MRHSASIQPVTVDDFVAYMPTHQYIFTPTGELWPATSVNASMLPIPVGSEWDEKTGNDVLVYATASEWLDQHHPVQQMTWAPGEQQLIRDRLIDNGGWFGRPGSTVYNLYRPPGDMPGDPMKAGRWLDHGTRIYPDEFQHIVRWFAHRVQRPGEKVNHALLLGGPQGIGKDTLFEAVRMAVGPWNVQEISPANLLGRFNPFVKSVILRVSEARDLGDSDRHAFYEHMKAYAAAPPDVLRCDEKNLREHYLPNVCGVVITTNHKSDGIYLPADDRRHYVAWSDRTKADFDDAYWNGFYSWYAAGGYGHVAAYLRNMALTGWNPKAPPPKTDAFYAIVDAGRAPEDAELATALESLGYPEVITIDEIANRAGGDFADWLRNRKNSRLIPHRLEEVGYVAVRNPTNERDGLWRVNGKQQRIYAKKVLVVRDQLTAARALTQSGS
ncbi:MAG: primase-helicase family protein [Longimicrobiales bacterium]